MDFINFDAKEIARHLGIERVIANREPLRVLDIGCGQYASFPRYLLSNGLDAEGIDSEIEEDIFKLHPCRLIKRDVTANYPALGSIPSTSGRYDLVIIHQNNVLNETFTVFRDSDYYQTLYADEMDNLNKKNQIHGPILVKEALRVAKEEGVAIVYPALDKLDKYFPELKQSGWKYVHQKANGVSSYEMFIESPYTPLEDCSSSIGFRTIFYKHEGKLLENIK
jgi:hypothetical protein